MKYLTLRHTSQSAVSLPVIGFGAMGISEFYGATDDEQAREALAYALDHGVTHFDTADCYQFGDNERWLGQALSGTPRGSYLVASKAGIVRDRHDPAARGICIDANYIQRQLEQSLANLNTDYLDLFYIHRLPPQATESELTALAGRLAELKAQGMVRAIGLSEPRLSWLQFIHQRCPVSVVQSEFSLLERTVERNGVLDWCREQQIAFVAYSPLCRGLLTEGFQLPSDSADFRRALPRFSPHNLEHNQALAAQLAAVARRHGMTLPALAIAWLIGQGVAVIPGMRKAQRVEEALSALACNLTPQMLEELEALLSAHPVQGLRYAPQAMRAFGFDSERG
ncbi:aldo/keto reductase [Entomohabitans teleogrylli]|uniref:aldo/keto reductase n=1 Tax=Entomohabitans teleogrylli TaxID=1384589 RepID=UPI00073D6739|nr:aldo/keto reductase [Entomohabitans teleogrylli]